MQRNQIRVRTSTNIGKHELNVKVFTGLQDRGTQELFVSAKHVNKTTDL